MNKREFDNHRVYGTSNDRDMSIGGLRTYRILRCKGDDLPRDRLAIGWRGLVPTWGKAPTRRGAWLKTYGMRTRLIPHGAHPGDRVRYMLEMRKGNYDHYIGDSGFAAWSKGVRRRWCRIAWLALERDRSRRICYVRSILKNPDPDAIALPRI